MKKYVWNLVFFISNMEMADLQDLKKTFPGFLIICNFTTIIFTSFSLLFS